MMDDADGYLPAAYYVALWAAGWLVNATWVPAGYQVHVAGALVLAAILGGYAALSLLGLEVTGGRCRASTADGSRCKLSRGPMDDLCHVHQRTHGAELHPDAVQDAHGGRTP